jgi:hypothetical protein
MRFDGDLGRPARDIRDGLGVLDIQTRRELAEAFA